MRQGPSLTQWDGELLLSINDFINTSVIMAGMDRNSIIALPNPHLRQTSQRVGVITDDVEKLIADMKKATIDWELLS